MVGRKPFCVRDGSVWCGGGGYCCTSSRCDGFDGGNGASKNGFTHQTVRLCGSLPNGIADISNHTQSNPSGPSI